MTNLSQNVEGDKLMHSSVKAYQEVCKILGVKPVKITEEFRDVDGVSLVIVPDEAFDYKQLFKLAEEFGKEQPCKTYIYEDLYKLYSAEELSGEPTGKSYRSLYIPHKYNVKPATAEQQKKYYLGHVPTVLEAITYWFVLRGSDTALSFDNTYIRHFNLEPKQLGGWLGVPSSCVGYDGKPYLYNSAAEDDGDARVAVGSDLKPATSLEPSEEEAIELLKYRGYEIWRKL